MKKRKHKSTEKKVTPVKNPATVKKETPDSLLKDFIHDVFLSDIREYSQQTKLEVDRAIASSGKIQQEIKSQTDEVNTGVDEAKSKLKKLIDKVEGMEGDAEDRKKAIFEILNSVYSKVAGQNDEIMTGVDEAKSDLIKLAGIADGLVLNAEDAQQKIHEELSSLYGKVSGQNDELLTGVDEAQSDLRRLVNKVDDLGESNEDKWRTVSDTLEKLQDGAAKESSLKSIKDGSDDNRSNLNTQFAKMTRKLDELSTELSRISTDLEQSDQDRSERDTTISREIEVQADSLREAMQVLQRDLVRSGESASDHSKMQTSSESSPPKGLTAGKRSAGLPNFAKLDSQLVQLKNSIESINSKLSSL